MPRISWHNWARLRYENKKNYRLVMTNFDDAQNYQWVYHPNPQSLVKGEE